MFIDMVGFTALAQRDEPSALALLEENRQAIRPLLEKHAGREVKTTGDGFLVEFTSSLEAVRCAVEIQSKFKEANKSRPSENQFQVRIGIHLGDVILDGADLIGDAVNIASRIEALAPPGGICLTSQVYASVINKVDFKFDSLGTPRLKNISTPIEVYQIAGFGQATGEAGDSRPVLPEDRIAILPFTNMSPDQADEYFADGLTEELISTVSNIPGLRVIARTSVMRYKGTSKPISEIGRELNVGHVLEGSVRKAGDKIRISVQLIGATREEAHWTEKFDRQIVDIFEIQSEIAGKVAGVLQEHVLHPHLPAGRSETTRDPEAYLNYLRGRQFWNKRTQEDLQRAIGFFEESIKIDANFSRAYSGLADSYAALALLEFMAPTEAYPKAAEAVKQALALDPNLADARTSLGLIRFQYEWDWPGAERAFLEALDINRNYAPAHHFFADYLKAMGRFPEALAEIDKARELDPLSLAINTGVGHVLYLSGQYDRAIEEYRRAVELDPNFMATHVWFGRPYLEKGMFAEAVSELEIAVRLSGESTLALAMLGHGLASANRQDEAIHILEKLMKRKKDQYVPSYWIAVIYNGLKDRQQTVAWLKKAYEERSSWLVWSNVEPRFSWLKNDPDFALLMSAMKFV